MKSEAEREAHDSFLRWQEIRIKHFGYTVNLVLTLTTATLGFAVNLVVEKKITAIGLTVGTSLLALFAAIGTGLWANWSRLRDFRYSAKAARGRELHERNLAGETLNEKDRHRESSRDLYSEIADCYGKCSWTLLRIQLWTFVIGGLLLAGSVFTVSYSCNTRR